MLNILIVEDSAVILEYLSKIIQKANSDWNISTCTNYKTALNLAKQIYFDLFILDYELNKENPEENGISLGLALRNMSYYQNTPVIFETSFSNHIFDAVNQLNCIYYLVKPYEDEQVVEMINKINSFQDNSPRLALHDLNGIDNYLYARDILFVVSNRHHLDIYQTNDDTFTCIRHSLDKLEEDAGGMLIRCHKSYLVNPKYITNIDRSNFYITLTSAHKKSYTVSVGRKYCDIIYDKIITY